MKDNNIYIRDLRTPLGEALSATQDLKEIIDLRLETATLDLSNVQQGYDCQRGAMDEAEQALEAARTKHAYWWAQKAKLEGQSTQEPYAEPEPAQKDVYPELRDVDAPGEEEPAPEEPTDGEAQEDPALNYRIRVATQDGDEYSGIVCSVRESDLEMLYEAMERVYEQSSVVVEQDSGDVLILPVSRVKSITLVEQAGKGA